MAFTINFYDEDRTTLLETQVLDPGVTPVYSGPTPTKAPTATIAYTFSGWTPTIYPAGQDANYYATYAASTRLYDIIFYDEDGTTVLDEQHLEYEAVPEYAGTTPTKAATAQYTYTFSGWNPEIVEVTEDKAYVAVYTAAVNSYNITFMDYDGTTVLKEATSYPYGTQAADIEKPDDPTRDPDAQYTYEFDGWSPELAEVTEDAVYTATYSTTTNQYRIVFKSEFDEILQDRMYDYGATPECEIPEKDLLTGSWTPAVETVTEDAEYELSYTSFAIMLWRDESMDLEYCRAVFMIESSSDIDNMPEWAAPGSVAFLADMTAFWVVDVDGEWAESTSEALKLLSLYS